jgi:hypothetical protein|nr:hypothetical protein [Halochromatium glycolicum]
MAWTNSMIMAIAPEHQLMPLRSAAQEDHHRDDAVGLQQVAEV